MSFCGCGVKRSDITSNPPTRESTRSSSPSSQLYRKKDLDRASAMSFSGPSPAFVNRPEQNERAITDSKIYTSFTKKAFKAFACPGSQSEQGFPIGQFVFSRNYSTPYTKQYNFVPDPAANESNRLKNATLLFRVAYGNSNPSKIRFTTHFFNNKNQSESKPNLLSLRSIHTKSKGEEDLTLVFTKNPLDGRTQLVLKLERNQR